MKKLCILVLAVFAAVTVSNAQVCAVKTNLLTYPIGAANVGVEFSVAPQWSIDLEGLGFIFSPWKNAGKGLYFNGWDVVGECRYYLCRAFNGHHFGVFGEMARFGEANAPYPYGTHRMLDNVKAAGLGISYGYYFKLNTYWGIDATAGIGLGAGTYTGMKAANGKSITLLPLPRANVSLSYKF